MLCVCVPAAERLAEFGGMDSPSAGRRATHTDYGAHREREAVRVAGTRGLLYIICKRRARTEHQCALIYGCKIAARKVRVGCLDCEMGGYRFYKKQASMPLK